MSAHAPLDSALDDAEARALIRTALDETLTVEAAAGTGKTTVLVDRMVNVLASGRATVDRLVAVTFTEKAAGELKLRLRMRLERERADATGEGRRHLEDALANLEQAHVSTIHTFCADLLRERPVEARVDPQFTMLAETEAQRVFGDVFDDWVQAQLRGPAPPPGVRRALRRSSFGSDGGPVGRLERAAWTLADWRDFSHQWRRDGFDQQARVDALVTGLAAFARLSGEPADREDPLYVSTAQARRLHAEIVLAEQMRTRDYDGLEARLADLFWSLRRVRAGRKTTPYRKGLPRTEVLAGHATLLAAVEAFKRAADADLAALLSAELREVVDGYQAAKRRAGALDFLDLLVLARDLVRDHPAVRAAFQERFTHLFVDEFQDTDPLQAELLLLLAAADPTETDWRRSVPVPGKLFIVGDPKQSIYRFRRADVGIYEEVRTQLAAHGARPLCLTASFRSVPAIQRVVNAAFAPLMQGSRETLQARYVPLSAVREDAAGQPAVVALPVPRPLGWQNQVRKNAVESSLPDAVGAFIAWVTTASGWTVTERERSGERVPIEPRHVCLLFRRFDTRVYGKGDSWMADVTRPYVEALEARGIPHLLVGGKSFHDREEVETMRTALAAVEWPDDELSVFGTLRGALFAIGDRELFQYRLAAGRVHPFRRPDRVAPGHEPIIEALDLLRDLHLRRNYRPVPETIARLIGYSRAHAIFALRPSGEQALANVQHIAELARQYEGAGGLSFRGFVDQLQQEAESTRAAEAPILEEGSDGVRIMTAHRAKGLEFPVVVLADLTAELSRDSASRWVDGATGRCAISLAGWAPADLLDHEAVEVARDAAEGVRVAYVAATRARDLLVVPAVGDAPYDSGWLSPLNDAIYPPWDRRREAVDGPGLPRFGPDSVLDREGSTPLSSVRPGLHRFGEAGAGYGVVWWDPAALTLGTLPSYGLRREELIAKDAPPGVIGAGRARYETWREGRAAAIAAGCQPSRRTVTVRARAAADDRAADDVRVFEVHAAGTRPAGPRFGALVHGALALVPLDADRQVIAAFVRQQARILAATDAESEAAIDTAARVLEHELFARIRAAEARGAVRREVPVAFADADGSLVEGVVDLAFEEAGAWTVVDFKTDVELGASRDTYLRQVRLYADAIARATGQPAHGILLRV